MVGDIKLFSSSLVGVWHSIWEPGDRWVIDESVYEFDGTKCPCKVYSLLSHPSSSMSEILFFSLMNYFSYIFRKPHPNGAKTEGMSSYTAVQKVPMVLDIEPYVPGNKKTPRDSARALVSRFQLYHPGKSLNLVMDSGFGSFEEMDYYLGIGVKAVMSMPTKDKAWLWDLLSWGLPLNSGRTSLIPLLNGNILASIYRVKSDTGKIIDIRTAASAFSYKPAPEAETQVIAILDRTAVGEKFKYSTKWADGDTTDEFASAFVDDDGTFNVIWLEKATPEDVKGALKGFTNAELASMCDKQGIKVLFHFLSDFFNFLISFSQKTGTKDKLEKRLINAALELKKDEQAWAETLLASSIGDTVGGESSNSGRLRRFYTNSYKSLDQFDALWYEIFYDKRDTHWETVFLWAMVLDCVINGRAMYCELNAVKEPIKDFARGVVMEIKEMLMKVKE